MWQFLQYVGYHACMFVSAFFAYLGNAMHIGFQSYHGETESEIWDFKKKKNVYVNGHTSIYAYVYVYVYAYVYVL